MTAITAEERTKWRAQIKADAGIYNIHLKDMLGKSLNALEAAEARADKAEAERDWLAHEIPAVLKECIDGYGFSGDEADLWSAEDWLKMAAAEAQRSASLPSGNTPCVSKNAESEMQSDEKGREVGISGGVIPS